MALHTFCLFVITGCWQLKQGGGGHKPREWIHVHPMLAWRHHAPHHGLRKLLCGQSWVAHLPLVRGVNLPTRCSWWGDQGHPPGG